MENLPVINLQQKTRPLKGTVTSYLFENESIGLKETRFHMVTIPLRAFDSGLENEEGKVKTKIIFDSYDLGLDDPKDLNGLNLNHEEYPDADVSVYIGGAHNRCRVNALSFQELEEGEYAVRCDLLVEFEDEMVAQNEPLTFETTVKYRKKAPGLLSAVPV